MTDGPKWTKEQQAGIETTGVNLLVSAAAGSGKTAVLSERCAYLVCDAKPPCDVDQLLVVTYTEAAAAEMKGRIETALRNRLERNPEDNRLRSQLAQIDRAQVSTLHGFCSRLLRQHFHLLELDPNFTVLDGDEATLLRLEVARDLFADRYESDDNGIFQKLIDVYGDGADEELQNQVIRTHELLCSVIDPEAWIAQARARIDDGANKPLHDCALGKELAAIIRRRLSALADRCTASIAAISRLDGLGKFVDYLQTFSTAFDHCIQSFGDCNFDALATAIYAFNPAKLPSIKSGTPGKEAAVAAIDSVRIELGEKGSLYPLIRFSSREWSDGLKTVQPFANVFLDLVEQFRDRYAAAKERARGIDFSDLERLTLQVLRKDDNGRWIPSPVARACQRHFAHVLVDEYQDVNGVQEAILSLVSRDPQSWHGLPARVGGREVNQRLNPDAILSDESPTRAGSSCHEQGLRQSRTDPNLFCVGDVKQSIYGFRLAEPVRFLERYHRFKSNPRAGAVIDLQANFRSRAPLLGALNGLFERLMTREAADLTYDDSQKLRPGATYPPAGDQASFTGAPIELHLLPREVAPTGEDEEPTADLDRSEREASFIASRIHSLMGHDGSPRMQVADRGPEGEPILRPIDYRDIVLLLRSMKYKSDQFADILRRHGIPVHRDSNTGYFNSTEVRDMLALLHLLDNGQQDIPLAAVLRSPLAGLAAPEDSLARVRLVYRSTPEPIPFHEAVARYATEQHDELAARLKDFLDQLARWRTASRLRPLADLIWRVYDDTGYLSFCSGLENGDQRCANLLYLHDRAKQFGSFSRQGLYRFLRFLEELETESDLGQPSVLGAGEDVVRIMSVHRSKGLEFPVVFLPDLGKKINLRDITGRVLVDRVRYLGLPAVDEAKQVRYPSLASVLVSDRLRQQTMAEELRVLYVAATRAKEHLILVGTCDGKSPQRWQTLYGSHSGPLPAEAVLAAGNMLEWIGPVAAALNGAGANAFAITGHSAEELNDWNVAASAHGELTPEQARYAALKPLDPPPPKNALADAVIQRLAYSYPHAPFSRLRAALPVTEWAKNEKDGPVGSALADETSTRNDAVRPPATSTGRLLPLPRVIAGETELGVTDKGAATHLVLEHLDFSRPCGPHDLRAQIEWMQHRKLITAAQADVVDHAAIEWFANSEIGQLLRHSAPENIIREIPFNLSLPPESFPNTPASTDGLDQTMLRGRIDLLVRKDHSFIVIDYKTDNVTGEHIETRKQSYQSQVQLYRHAIEKLTGVNVRDVYLIFLTPRITRGM